MNVAQRQAGTIVAAIILRCRYFTDGTVDRNINLLWEPNQPPSAGGDFGCVAARLSGEAGSARGGAGITWTGKNFSITSSHFIDCKCLTLDGNSLL